MFHAFRIKLELDVRIQTMEHVFLTIFDDAADTRSGGVVGKSYIYCRITWAPVNSGHLITAKINMQFSKYIGHDYTSSSNLTIGHKTDFFLLMKVLIGPSYSRSFRNELDLESL